MSGEPAFEPERVVAALNDAGARYVIVGGLAVGAHGVVRATRDLDLVCADEAENMTRVAGCLAALGAEHPVEERLTGAALARPARLKLCSLAHLRSMKRAAGRPRDLAGLAELDEVHRSDGEA